ncbi:MAG: 3-oxoacyl-ACP reductase FabG [Cellvibrionales bacterium]|nr:3-oxoacyl-ACP reductase FabG [Cellvibrionales bacterium]
MSDKKVALVTGASRGIGAAIADQLVSDGYLVVGTATSAKGAEAISHRLETLEGEGTGMVLNVTDKDNVAEVVKDITAKFGAPLILVNNAGITRDNLFLRMKESEWNEVIDTNLNALFTVSKACIKGMTKARFGRIINISSVVGSMGNAGQANYAATKAAADGFSRALAAEVGSRAITVNSVAPGFIDTDMTKELPESQRDALLGQIPLGRLGDPSEIASVVSFLAGESASYVTGTTIHVNGGMYMA